MLPRNPFHFRAIGLVQAHISMICVFIYVNGYVICGGSNCLTFNVKPATKYDYINIFQLNFKQMWITSIQEIIVQM